MPQSLSKIILHIVFETKYRQKVIPDHIKSDLHSFLSGICKDLGVRLFRINGTSDHIHIACQLSRTITVAKLVEHLKRKSSRWIKTQDPQCRQFQWQGGYAAFTIAYNDHLDTLIKYIDNQEYHHKKKTRDEELTDLLVKYQIDFDPKYLWD